MTTLFTLDNVSFAHGPRTVIEALDLTIEAGRFHGVIGPNGSGKTTLLDLLCGLTRPRSGSITFKGRDLSTIPRRELARHIALVPQEFRLAFDFTIRDVALMGRHPHIPRFAGPTVLDLKCTDEALAAMDLTPLAERLVTQVSGGEKQRAVVARALAQDTEVLILDEATASLDISHAIKIMRHAKRLTRDSGRTVIAAIHDLNFAAAYCDHLILLHQGRLAACGPPRRVLTPEHLAAVFELAARPYEERKNGTYQLAYDYQ